MYFKERIKPIYLILTLFVLIMGLSLVYLTCTTEQSDDYNLLLASSVRMQKALDAIKDYCEKNNISLEEEDVNGTYLIGPYYSPLMSTMGYPDIKRTTTNPNFAAVMAKYYLQAGLEPGSTVAVGTSGSFPASAVAALCAATELKLNTKVIASYGSSMYGATREELNIVTIIRLLQQANIIDCDLVAVSPGSHADTGVGSLDGFIYDNTRQTVLNLASQSGTYLIDPINLAQSIKERLELFGEIDCFVNIGGAGANSGSSSFSLDFPEGLVTHVDNIPKDPQRGLVFEYAEQGIPVINILNIKKIASDNGLPFDPSPLPSAGEGGIYYQTTYNPILIITTLVLSLGILVLGRKY